MKQMKLFGILFFLIYIKNSFCHSNSIKLGVIADWGGIPIFPYKTFVELSVGRELDNLARKIGLDAILALGDNFYLNGVQNINDSRFKETFETAFDYKSLHIPWLVVAGNHDHYGNVSAQIKYSIYSQRWHFPDYYYKKTMVLPFSNFTLDIVMIDTVVLCGNTDPQHPFEQPYFDAKSYATAKHWQWLQDVLKNSKANYIIVGGHYPVYSIATHGPTDCLVNNLQPLLEKYYVSAYFSGHDHNIQHIQVQNGRNIMDYVVTGSANIIDPSKKNWNKIPPKSLLFHWGNPFSLGAFTFLNISPTNMTVAFYLSSGKLLYSFFKQPRWY